MKASDFLKQFEQRKKTSGEEEKEHTLQENAKERAQHPDHMNVGTPYDWEELEGYKKELERLDREGPKRSDPQSKHDNSQ